MISWTRRIVFQTTNPNPTSTQYGWPNPMIVYWNLEERLYGQIADVHKFNINIKENQDGF